MSLFAHVKPVLSGERFEVYYRILGSKEEVQDKAQGICLEQTIEFPGELLASGPIRDEIVGRIEALDRYDDESWLARISYATETSGFELLQLLNVIFGNSSIKPGIRVEHLELGSLTPIFKGPRFGISGLRQLLNIPKRPLLFTALKPMGLSSSDLAQLAYQFGKGGIDIIKDDHGLTDQSFSPFQERVELCAQAVQKANAETGGHSIYVPNITSSHSKIRERAIKAKNAGAGGLLISPGLVGIDALREIAEDDSIALPIFTHPAFQGSYVLSDSGISPKVMFGELARMAGADATIFPNFGGRFSFTRDECASIAEGSTAPMDGLSPIFPCPAGGMTLESIPESLRLYGNDVIFLIGGGLFRQGPDLVENSKYFRTMVEELSARL